MAKNAKPTIGGARPGSGRPPMHPEGKTTRIGITIPQPLLDKLDDWRESRDMNLSQAITEAMRQFLKRRRKPSRKS